MSEENKIEGQTVVEKAPRNRRERREMEQSKGSGGRGQDQAVAKVDDVDVLASATAAITAHANIDAEIFASFSPLYATLAKVDVALASATEETRPTLELTRARVMDQLQARKDGAARAFRGLYRDIMVKHTGGK